MGVIKTDGLRRYGDAVRFFNFRVYNIDAVCFSEISRFVRYEIISVEIVKLKTVAFSEMK